MKAGWNPNRLSKLERSLSRVTGKRRWARAILLRLGFYNGQPLTLREVGRRLGREDDPTTPILAKGARQLLFAGFVRLFRRGSGGHFVPKLIVAELEQALADFYGLEEPLTIDPRDHSLNGVVQAIRGHLWERSP
jgi:hypothetical protein